MAIGNTLANLAVTNDTALKAMELCFKQMGETQKNLAEMYAKQKEARETKVTTEYQKSLETLELQEAQEKEALIAAAQKVEKRTQPAEALTTSEKVEGFFSGIGKTIKGMFCDEKGFSVKRTLTTVAVGAAAALACTNPVGLAVVAGAGIISGSVHLTKGIVKANAAKTKEEAYAAYEDIGGATFEIAGSIAGAKTAAGLKITKGGLRGTYKAAKNSVVETYKTVRHPKTTYENYKNALSNLEENYTAKTDIANTKANVKAKITEKYTSKISELESAKEANTAKIAELKQNKKNTTEVNKLEAKNKEYDEQIAALNEQVKNLDTEVAGGTLKQNLEARSLRMDELKAQIKENEATIATKKQISKKTDAQKQEIEKLEQANKALSEELKNQEKLYATEIQNRKIEVREARIEKLQKQVENNEKAIETMNKQIEILTSKNTNNEYTNTIQTIKETIAKTEKAIKNAQEKIANHETAIREAEQALKIQNTKAIVPQLIKNPETIQGIITTAAVNGAVYGNEPAEAELIEVTTVDPQIEEKLAQLEQEQLKRRQELEKNYKTTISQTTFNPFLMNMFSTGLDNWAFYRPAF